MPSMPMPKLALRSAKTDTKQLPLPWPLRGEQQFIYNSFFKTSHRPVSRENTDSTTDLSYFYYHVKFSLSLALSSLFFIEILGY